MTMSVIEKKLANKGRSQKGEASETISVENRLSETLLSSQTRLRIAELISRRPRTLRELARLTGLSIPGVLRHIEAMSKAGLILEERVKVRMLSARKLYSLKDMRVVDFSVGDLTIFKVAMAKSAKENDAQDIDSLAMEIFVGRRRIGEKARRLARAIDELVENEEMLAKGIDSLELTDEERLILLTLYTEETADDAERVLTRVQGVRDARRSIDEALSKVKHNVGK
jgi:DNA-binding MarR family transcriptional regulator